MLVLPLLAPPLRPPPLEDVLRQPGSLQVLPVARARRLEHLLLEVVQPPRLIRRSLLRLRLRLTLRPLLPAAPAARSSAHHLGYATSTAAAGLFHAKHPGDPGGVHAA